MRCRSRAKGQDIWLDPQVSMRRAARVRWGADGRQIFRPQLARLGQPCPFLRSDCLHGSAWSGCRCKNVFSYFYGWLCVLRVCACDSLNVCAHVDMRGSCCRARANRTMPPPTRVVMTCSSSFPRMVFILFASHDVIMTIVTNGGRASRRD